jgi:hypothetical protein
MRLELGRPSQNRARPPRRPSSEVIVTRRVHFAVLLTPHDFRRCAASTVAEINPDEFHIIRAILGQATIALAERYIQARGIEAARLFQATVANKRKMLSGSARLSDEVPADRGCQVLARNEGPPVAHGICVVRCGRTVVMPSAIAIHGRTGSDIVRTNENSLDTIRS